MTHSEMRVLTTPGATALIRIPNRARSSAAARTNVTTAPFVVEYGTRFSSTCVAFVDAVTRIVFPAGDPESRIARPASCTHTNTPVTLTSMTRCQSASVTSSSGASPAMPACATMTSSASGVRDARVDRPPHVDPRGDVAADGDGGGAQRCRGALGQRRHPCRTARPSPPARRTCGTPGADALRGAGHHHPLALPWNRVGHVPAPASAAACRAKSSMRSGPSSTPSSRVVAALLTRREKDELAALAGVEAAGIPVRARLHRDRVGAVAELPPRDVVRQGAGGVALVDAEAERAVRDGRGDRTVGIGHHGVLVALLDEGGVRVAERPVVDRRRVAHHRAGRRRVEQFGVRGHDRGTDVAVVQQHVGARRAADVGHPVDDAQRCAAQVRLDAPAQFELLAEDGDLAHLALGPEHALVAHPLGAVADQAGRDRGVPPVQPVLLGAVVRVVEVAGVIGAAEQGVVEPAGRDQSAGPAAEPLDAARVDERGRLQPHRRPPRERCAAEGRPTDIEPAIDQHLELQSAARREPQQPDSPGRTVRRLDEFDSRDLLEAADPREQFRPAPGATPHVRHPGLLGLASEWRVGLRAEPVHPAD